MSPKLLRWCLIAITCGLCLLFTDMMIVSVALSVMQKSLQLSASATVWIINVYLLVLAILTMPAGRLCDFFQTSSVLTVGFIVFTMGSLCSAFAVNGVMMIVGRAIQGVGGVMISAPGMSLINEVFPKDKRGRATGMVLSISSICLIAAPLLGGLLIHALNWRSIFLINVPVALFGMVALKMIKVHQEPKVAKNRFDAYGAVLLAVFTALTTLAIMQGWFLVLIPAMLVLLIFIRYEAAVDQPLIKLSLFKNKRFLLACLACLLIQTVSMSFIFGMMYFQQVLGWTPLMSGLGSLPTMVLMLIFSYLSGAFIDKFGAYRSLICGASVLIIGYAVTFFLMKSPSYVVFLPSMCAYGIGGFFVTSGLRFILLDHLPDSQAGMALGLFGGIKQIGGTIGVACLTYVMFHHKASKVINTEIYQDHYKHVIGLLLLIVTVIFLTALVLRWLPDQRKLSLKLA